MAKQNFNVTFGYKAVITVPVKAENEEEAISKAEDIFKNCKNKIYNHKLILEDDTYSADGVLNMDKTWGIL